MRVRLSPRAQKLYQLTRTALRYTILNMEDKQYQELVEFIGGQFNKVWTSFDKVWTSFDGVSKEFNSVHHDFDDLKSDFRKLQTSVDLYAQKADTYFMEMAAMSNKLERHERWMNILAEKLGVKLPS